MFNGKFGHIRNWVRTRHSWKIDETRGHKSTMQVTADQYILHPLLLLNDPIHLKFLKKIALINLSLALRLISLSTGFEIQKQPP